MNNSNIDYSKTNFKLIPIVPNTKKPRDNGWQQDTYIGTNFTKQIGLAHKYSGTCSLDLDNYSKSVELFNSFGIDLGDLCSRNVGILSGKLNHYKLLFKLDKPLQTKKIVINKETIIEFRCATSNGLTVQDIIPPSVHPDTGKPYEWRGDFHNLQPLPESIKKIWLDLINGSSGSNNPNGGVKAKVDTTWTEIDKMLECIPADTDRQTWLNIAMAVHGFDYLSNDKLGYSKFLKWSKTGGESFKGEGDVRTTWNSIKVSSNGIGIGTLFTIAYGYGYVKDKKHLFTRVGTGMDNSVDKPVDNSVDNETMGEPKHPEDIIRDLMPAEPQMDLNILPPIIKDYATELSETIGSDPAVSVLAMLSVVCGVADARMRLKLMLNFEVPPVMWFMTVGSPSSKKTPASKPVFEILDELEKGARNNYNTEMINWEAKEAIYNREKKEYIENADSSLPLNDVTFQIPDALPKKPAPLRFTVSDITSQKLVRHCSIRPEGTLCYLDEMTGWIDKMTTDKTGDDNATWLEGYSASNYTLDRVVDGEIQCDNFAVSIYGNVQPKVLKSKIKVLARDGILQRFIPVILRKRFNKVGTPIPEQGSKIRLWEQHIRTIHANAQLRYTLDEGAYNKFREFQHWVEDYKRNLERVDDDDTVMTAVGKVEGVVGRLALIFHLVENPYDVRVPEGTMSRVIEWTKNFIIPSYRHTYGQSGASRDIEIEICLMEHIVQQADTKDTITIRDLKRISKAVMRKLEVERDDAKTSLLKEAMDYLEEQNWVTLLQDIGNSTTWRINSKVGTEFKEYRDKIRDEAKRTKASKDVICI